MCLEVSSNMGAANGIDIVEMITILTSLLALIISLLTYFLTRKKLITETITKNRINWITEVRSYCAEFIGELTKDSPDLQNMKELKIKIMLYGRRGLGEKGPYDSLFNNISKAINIVEQSNTTETKEQIISVLIGSSQAVLNDVWWRMKREVGITKKTDKKIEKEIEKKYKLF